MYVRQGQHAVVIGAGIAGLLAARVLSDHYAHVTVLERDDLVQTEAPRAGVPQGHHVHGLLARGAAIFEEFFPGLRQDLRQAGAPLGDFGDTVAFRFPEGWSPRTTLGISLQTFTRPLLESRLHHRVASLPTVTFRPGTSVVGLTGSATRVTGIRTRPRLGTAPHEYIVDADLVVDASGRSSRMPEWLQALGLPRPRETVIDAHLGYATRIYKIPEQVYCPWNAATEPLQPPTTTRGFMATLIEQDRLLVTLQGAAGDHPPHDPDGFDAFVSTLRSPLADFLSRLTPDSPIHRYARCANRRVDYHRIRPWPDGLLAIGDAVCAFNPLYGQGMTVAGIEAQLLQHILATEHDTAPRWCADLQHRFAHCTRWPWLMSTLADRNWQPHPDFTARTANVFLSSLQRAIPDNPELLRRFASVMHMLTGPHSLLHPYVVRRTATAAVLPLMRSRRATTTPPRGENSRLRW